MNIVELETELTKLNITINNRLICSIWGMDEASYSRKKKAGTEIKPKNIAQIEEQFGISFQKEVKRSEDIELDYYPDVHASAGFGELILEEHVEKIVVTKDVIKNYSKSNKYSVIDCKGDSMEPRLLDGDKLIVKHNVENIVDNNVYVFRYDGDLYVKRLARNLDEIIVMSENKRFSDKVVKKGTVTLLGEIVGLIRCKV